MISNPRTFEKHYEWNGSQQHRYTSHHDQRISHGERTEHLSAVDQHLVQWSEERIGLTFSVNMAKLEPRRIRKNDIPATAELAKAP